MSAGKSTTSQVSGNAPASSGLPTQNDSALKHSLANAFELPKKMMEANLDASAELMTFFSRRMRAQADLLSGVGHCRDMSEASDMQRKFMEKVTQDYTDEMTHLADIARKNLAKVSGLMSPKGETGQRVI